MSAKGFAGLILIIAGFILIIPLFSLTQPLPFVISLLLLLLSVLSGRKIAYLVHDSKVLNKKLRRNFSPLRLISIWIFLFILMVMVYTISSQIFFKSLGLIFGVLKGSYTGMASSILVILGAYIFYREHGDSKGDILLSSWGRRIERFSNMAKNAKNSFLNFMKKPLFR